MADAPAPITSPPAQEFQPYSATESGSDDSAPGPGQVYAGNGPPASGNVWTKVRDGGGASMTDGSLPGSHWPDDGTSNGSQWKQT